MTEMFQWKKKISAQQQKERRKERKNHVYMKKLSRRKEKRNTQIENAKRWENNFEVILK